MCFGTFAVVGKIALRELSPLSLATLRVVAASVLLQVIRRAKTRERIIGPREVARFLLAALLGVVLNQGFFLLGLSRTTAIHTVLIIATIPAFAHGASVLAGVERFSWRKAGGIALAFAGIGALLAARPSPSVIERPSLGGDLLVAANSLSYAVFLVVSRPLSRRYEPITVTAWVFTFGAVVFAAIGGPGLARLDWGAISGRTWAALAFIVVFPTGVAYYISSWALRRAEASVVAAYVFIQPIVTTLLAVPLLGERPGITAGAAAAAIFAGVMVVVRAGGESGGGRP